MLIENEIKVNGKPTQSDEDFDIMRQRPNRGLGNVRLFLSMYQLGDRLGDNGMGNWLKSIGEPPHYYDSIARLTSASQLGLHYFNLGYYNAEITTYETIKGKKVTAHYHIYTGPEYTINDYAITSTSRFMDSTLSHYVPSVSVGDPIAVEALETEQLRLTNHLKDLGFYQAKLGWIYFDVDTTVGPDLSRITCVVDPYIYGGDIDRIRIDKITVRPTYSYRKDSEITDSTRTLHGIDVLQSDRIFRPHFLDQQIFLEKDQFYSNTGLRSTYKNLTALGVFQNVEVDIVPHDSALAAHIKLVPLPKRAITASLEGLGNSGSLGIGGNFSWDNRNVFGGGELLRASLGGSVTEQRNSSNNSWLIDARELNSGVSLRLPKLLLPSRWLPTQAKTWTPVTEISAKASYQFRANEFNRLNLTSSLDYNWKIGPAKHTLTPWQLSFVRIDLNSTTTPFLFLGFQDVVFSNSGYRFTDTWSRGTRRYFLALDAESGGHLWRLGGITDLYGTPISEYVKGSVDFRLYQSLVHHRELAFRGFAGVAQSWGSASGFMPFEKSFFMGGSNDLRGWTAYHFGPGATSEDIVQTEGFFSAAPIKLLASAEYRYTLQGALKGALFVDAGNMWLYNTTYTGNFSQTQLDAIAQGTFGWSTFLSQLGVNTGLGIRYDIEFFILRADLGLKLHHPGAVDRSTWVVTSPKWRDLNLNLGIGYPF